MTVIIKSWGTKAWEISPEESAAMQKAHDGYAKLLKAAGFVIQQLPILTVPTKQVLYTNVPKPGEGFPLKMEALDFVLKSTQHASVVEDSEGLLTPLGMGVVHRYAKLWVDSGSRDLALERLYPSLEGLFYDIRSDADLASMHASD